MRLLGRRPACAAFVSVVLVGSFFVGGASDAASSTTPACRLPRGAVLLASNKLAVVYRHRIRLDSGGTRTTLYGCWKPKRKRMVLKRAINDARFASTTGWVRLANRYVAFLFVSRDAQTGDNSDELWRANLSTGSRYTIAGVTHALTSWRFEAIAINRRGFMAWQFDGDQGDLIQAHGSRPNQTLDAGPYEFTRLHLSSRNVVSWYRGAERRSAVLR